jgi:hypothetical protein
LKIKNTFITISEIIVISISLKKLLKETEREVRNMQSSGYKGYTTHKKPAHAPARQRGKMSALGQFLFDWH